MRRVRYFKKPTTGRVVERRTARRDKPPDNDANAVSRVPSAGV